MAHRSIIDRVKTLGLPESEFIVIGSGVMDVLGLRESHDIDLVASKALFTQLALIGWEERKQHGVDMLMRDDAEVWPSWYHLGHHHTLNELLRRSVEIKGVRFVSPDFLLEWKRAAHREKDLPDIKLLEEHLSGK